MSHLTESMVEQFIEAEKENARGVLRKEMDSCMDTIFKQMKRKLMMLVESGRGGDETGHGLAHLGDPVDREQRHSSSINSHAQLSDLNASNQPYQGGLNDLVYYGQQLYQSSNLIHSTSNNQSHVPDNATSNKSHDDEITVKNELGEIVNIIPNESIPSSSTQSRSSNDEQSNDNDLFDEFDEGEEDCDCPECVGDAFVKMENYQEEDDDDDVQLIEDIDESNNSRPTKRPRNANDQQAQPNNNKSNQFITISLKCPECSQMFQERNSLNLHLKVVHSIRRYRCLYKDCRQSFDNNHLLVHHNHTNHANTTKWSCALCSSQFKNHYTLTAHHTNHHQEGLFQCSVCKFTDKFKHLLSNHFKAKHNRQFVCTLMNCAKRFRDLCRLKEHEHSHRNLKPFRCSWPDCSGYDSSYRSNVIAHIRKHLDRLDSQVSSDPNDYLEVMNELL